MHQALYRKWRPHSFDDVCGQEHITSVLKYEVENKKINHAYLFYGSRGTGKTTCAKILASALNCENPINGNPCGKCASCLAIANSETTDITEMDAASNNGVDNIRDIREEVSYAPSFLKYRVYIIDEVHMLSTSAFNALLKTLEEPPEHIVFILATTELQKLPATIVSRCQRFDFRRISSPIIAQRLDFIAKNEQINLDKSAATLLARLSSGGMRDAISLLELCAGNNKEVSVATVQSSLGIVDKSALASTVRAILNSDCDYLFNAIEECVNSSKDILFFWQDLISFYRDLLVIKTSKNAEKYLDLTEEEAKELSSIANILTKEKLLYHAKLLENALFAMQKSNSSKRMIAELTLIRMTSESYDTSVEALASRIQKLEERPFTITAQVVEKVVEEPIKVEKPIDKPKAKEVVQEAPKKEEHNQVKFKKWADVVERLRAKDPMLSSFLSETKATLDGDIITIYFSNGFAKTQCERPSNEDKIRATLSAVLQREVLEYQMNFQQVESQKELSAIDEFLEEGD